MNKVYLILVVMVFMLVPTALAVSPIINSSRISPTSPYSNETLVGYCNATDGDGGNITYYWNWYKDDTLYSSSEATWEYQETADSITPDLSSTYVYLNYTKSENSLSTSLWLTQHGLLNPYNSSIPAPCMDAYPNTLVLRAYAKQQSAGGSWGECYNGTSWIVATSQQSGVPQGGGSGSGAHAKIYDGNWATGAMYYSGTWYGDGGFIGAVTGIFVEEAMWWNNNAQYTESVEQNVANISSAVTSSGDTWIFECIANDFGTNSSALNSTGVVINSSVPILNVTPDTWSGSQDSDDQFSFVFNVSNTGSDATDCTVNFTNTTLNNTMNYTAYNVSGGGWSNVTVTLNSVPVGSYVSDIQFDCNGVRAMPVPTAIFSVSVVVVPGTGGGGTEIIEIVLGYDVNLTIDPEVYHKKVRPGSDWIYEFKITNTGDIDLDMTLDINESDYSDYFTFISGEDTVNFTLPALNQFDPSTRFIRYKVTIPDNATADIFNITVLTAVEGIRQNYTYTLELEIDEGFLPDWLYNILNYPVYTYEGIELLNTNVTYVFSVTEDEQDCLDAGDCQEVEWIFKSWHLISILALLGLATSIISKTTKKQGRTK